MVRPRRCRRGFQREGLLSGRSRGADIASEQAALSAGWQGDTGMSYQAWQAQWNQAMEQLVLAYRAMAGTHENNTTSMLARDQAEGAKWGG
jgi:WXG100 family type VII secretion target